MFDGVSICYCFGCILGQILMLFTKNGNAAYDEIQDHQAIQ